MADRKDSWLKSKVKKFIKDKIVSPERTDEEKEYDRQNAVPGWMKRKMGMPVDKMPPGATFNMPSDCGHMRQLEAMKAIPGMKRTGTEKVIKAGKEFK